MTSAAHQQNLRNLAQRLQEHLRSLPQSVPIPLRCVLQQGNLLILGQHDATLKLMPQEVFGALEEAIQTLLPEFITSIDPSLRPYQSQVKLYLRHAGTQQPYITHEFQFLPTSQAEANSLAEHSRLAEQSMENVLSDRPRSRPSVPAIAGPDKHIRSPELEARNLGNLQALNATNLADPDLGEAADLGTPTQGHPDPVNLDLEAVNLDLEAVNLDLDLTDLLPEQLSSAPGSDSPFDAAPIIPYVGADGGESTASGWTTQPPSERRTPWGKVGLGLAGVTVAAASFAGGVWAMKQPCVLGSCEPVETAENLQKQLQDWNQQAQTKLAQPPLPLSQRAQARSTLVSTSPPDRKVGDRKVGDRKVGENKPADSKPVDSKPVDSKPVDQTMVQELQPLQQQLAITNQTLATIPLWSPWHGKAQALLKLTQPSAADMQVLLQAEQAAMAASDRSLDPATSPESVQSLWQKAIDHLDSLPANSAFKPFATRRLEELRQQMSSLADQGGLQQKALQRLNKAKSLAQVAQARQGIAMDIAAWQAVQVNWQGAITWLKQVPKDTTSYGEAQQLLLVYQKQLTSAGDRLRQAQAAQAALVEATSLAQRATGLEQQAQWPQALELWSQALKAAQQVPQQSPLYPQAQQLLPTYTQAQQRTTAAVKANQALTQKAEADLAQVCSGTPKICTYTISATAIRVQLTPTYEKSLKTAVSASQSNAQALGGTVDHLNALQGALQTVCDQAQRRLSVYNSTGKELIGSFNPQ